MTKTDKIRVGIVGGAGYTAGELIRILLYHPDVTLSFIQSGSHNGQPITAIHRDLVGETGLLFSEIDLEEVDLLFLCSGHGKSLEYLSQNTIPESVKIIDLSHDFRLKRDGNPFVYGLPELNRDAIRHSSRIANPGCFATGIQLALLPLAAAGLIAGDVHVNAITGSTGAGQAPTKTSHFSWRDNNLSVYKAFEHQHLGEICESLNQAQPGLNHAIHFIPVRGNHTRGIFTMAYTRYSGTLAEARKLYESYYEPHPFVHLTDENPDMKQVVNTNKCILYLENHGDQLMIISCTDNLLKGAS
ncbi:MAG TPA: N-acetyl-gamma-glutamyl-phosphate reductase, partial [Prolixibacteraceae bacterium]|nr:N-acetyl-gamma-glutamyl-phosphate reductase [Prolixibacteraceae bacterium]